MQAFTNILVDIDSNASVQPALEIGRRISQRCGAELRAVDIAAAVAARGSMIAAGGGTLAAEMLSSSLADALIDEVDRYGHDLVIRSQARDLAVRGDVAVQLFRRCPCPVWALGPAPLPRRPKIVAAVNASETDSLTLALNAKAIELALLLADLEGGMVSILHAWRPVAEKQLYVRSTPQEFDASIESAQERAARDLAALAGTFGTRLGRAKVELRRGLPEEAIPEFVVSEGVDIVIAGARGGGVWQRLFGSTAERLLEAAPCSLIVVKADASE